MLQDGAADFPVVFAEDFTCFGVISHRLRKGIDFIVEVADVAVQAGGGIVYLFLRISFRRVRSGLSGGHPFQIAQRQAIVAEGAVVLLLVVIQLADELGSQIRLIQGAQLVAQLISPFRRIHGAVRVDALVSVH